MSQMQKTQALFTINRISRMKKLKHDKPIIVTDDDDLFISECRIINNSRKNSFI